MLALSQQVDAVFQHVRYSRSGYFTGEMIMVPTQELTFFHSPNTRSTGALTLLKELGAPYQLHVINMKAGEQRQPPYLAINPMGKVPAVMHGDALITEQVAVFIYLADLYPQAGITAQIGDPLRGPYLRWMAFYGSCFEPAIIDRSQKREPAPQASSPYGDFDTMFTTLTDQLAKGQYLLGDKFTAVDVLWGTALTWITMFKLVPEVPVIRAYIDRVNARPSVAWARAKDAELVAAQS
jgi:glutathione S-transferase